MQAMAPQCLLIACVPCIASGSVLVAWVRRLRVQHRLYTFAGSLQTWLVRDFYSFRAAHWSRPDMQ